MEFNFFKDTNELVYKTETDLQILKINLRLAKWGGRVVRKGL